MLINTLPNDFALPGLANLLDTDWIASLTGCQAGNVSIRNIRYKPSTSCLVSYECAESGRYFHAKTVTKANWHSKQQNDEASWTDEGKCLQVFEYPADSRIPAIELFFANPNSLLDKILFSSARLRQHQRLNYKPNRRLTLSLEFENRQRAVLKMHSESKFRQVANSTRMLKKLGWSEGPERIGKSEKYCSIAYRWLDGQPFHLRNKNFRIDETAVESCIGFLDRLHGHSVSEMRETFPSFEAHRGIGEIREFLSTLAPELHDFLTQAERDIRKNLLKPTVLATIHGDFHEAQLVVSDGEVKAVDYDNFCQGDPTVDFANLAAQSALETTLSDVQSDQDSIDNYFREHLGRHYGQNAITRYFWNLQACKFRLLTHPFRMGRLDWKTKTVSFLTEINSQIENWTTTVPLSNRNANQLESIMNDDGFTKLHSYLDQIQKEKRLELSESSQPTAPSRSVSSTFGIRHKRGRRCLIEFTCQTPLGNEVILGKAITKDKSPRGMKIQRELFRKRGFGYEASDDIHVPKTLGHERKPNIWFQQKIDGQTAAELMKSGQVTEKADRISAAICKLHRSGLTVGRKHNVEDELSILRLRLSDIARENAACRNSIEQILAQCEILSTNLDSSLSLPIHRDFYQDQILFMDNKTFLLDLDLVSMGHPAFDIGNFIAHLTEDGIRVHNSANHWSELEKQITHSYLENCDFCTELEIQSAKWISLARHISIAWVVKSRRPCFPRLVATIHRLLVPLSSPAERKHTASTLELKS